MFDSIKGRIINAHQDLSASIRHLTVGDGLRTPGGTPSYCYNAGADLLNKYQTNWSEMHSMSETNAKLSDSVDSSIGSIYQHCQAQWVSIGQLTTHLSTLPKLVQEMKNTIQKLDELEELYQTVEKDLASLEEMTEIQSFQEQQLDERFQLALYKEKRLRDMEQLRETWKDSTQRHWSKSCTKLTRIAWISKSRAIQYYRDSEIQIWDSPGNYEIHHIIMSLISDKEKTWLL